ncbi:GNAT family N-acetyltransferase [uncultured Tateyamaria sp.]|uniref:GNAT family N-acetyltransferase n=1 Tax=uncultured Tateyamaria sp. TaxID=455651 RepID=UPI0026224FDC|nr:GNAT family N-acetyltransferase [uncultured Tateyamaria sp.]
MSVALIPAPRDQMAWLQATATAYFGELAPDEPPPPLEEIIDWFDDPDTFALLIMHQERRVGFALIERLDAHHDLSEFGILHDWRGKGLGTRAAPLCFARFPGPWALGVAKALPGTARFWDGLLPTLSGVTGLARGPALTPYQSHSYTFAYKGAP